MNTERDRGWEEDDPFESGGEEGPYGSRPGMEEADLSPLSRMSGRALRRLIERVDMETLSLALRCADADITDRVLRNLSSRTAAALREEIGALPFSGRDICLEAQHVLMETAYDLESRGDISFDGPADDAFPPLDASLESAIGGFSLPEADPAGTIGFLVRLAGRAHAHGLLSLEPVLERIPEGILATGLRMAVDQLEAEDIEAVLGRQIDSHLSFLDRMGEILIEGLLSIASGEDEERARGRLVAFLPAGAEDYERLPEMRLPPSAEATNRLIGLLCDLAGESRRKGPAALADRLDEISDPLLRRGVEWVSEGCGLEDLERMAERRCKTRTDRERRKLEVLLEGFFLIRQGTPPDRVREALEGFLEEMA
ncbi:MAG: FliG C-terminal domain-containing protein [bacterium]